MDDRRKFSRILFEAKAHLNQKGNFYTTKLLDLSLKGALIETPNNFQPTLNDKITLSFTLANSEIELSMNTHIAHISSAQLGLVTEHIDIDSLSHLRRIIELNLGDADLLYRELNTLHHTPYDD